VERQVSVDDMDMEVCDRDRESDINDIVMDVMMVLLNLMTLGSTITVS
jgi:hypothetical protein